MAQLRTRSRQKSNTPTPQQGSPQRARRATKVSESPRRSRRLNTQESAALEPHEKERVSAKQGSTPRRSAAGRPSKERLRPGKHAVAADLAPLEEAEIEDIEADDAEDYAEHSEAEEESVDGSIVQHPARRIERLKGQEQKLMDHLRDLSHESSGMLRLLLPRTGIETEEMQVEVQASINQLRDSGSSRSRRLYDREQRFDEIFHLYDDYYFIDHTGILKALFLTQSMDDVPKESWRPDDIFYAANLAVLAREILTLRPGSADSLPRLQLIDNSFPSPFLASFALPEALSSALPTIGVSQLADKTLDIAIAIRTQLLILHLQTSRRDPASLLKQVFYKKSDDRKLKGWPVTGFDPDLGAMSSIVKSGLALQVQNIGESLPVQGEADIEELVRRYPWSNFVVSVIEWIRLRHDEIIANMTKNGGFDDIHDQFTNAVEKKKAASKTSKPGQAPSSTKKFGRGSRGALRSVIQNLERLRGNPNAGADIPGSEVEGDLGGEGIEGEIQVIPPLRTQTPAERSPVQTPRRGQKRKTAFYDRQEDAVKLSQVSLGAPSPDRGFQHDRRGKRIAEARSETMGRPSGALSQSPNKRRRVQQQAVQENEPDAEYVPLVDDASEQRSEHTNTASERPDTIASSALQTRSYLAVKASARAPPPRKQQIRTPWSHAEITTLIDLIGWVGCSWAQIKKEDELRGGDVLSLRDQYGLKDKARNMKYDYLLAGVPLPKNFENVRLDAKLINRLADRGIYYDQERIRHTRVGVRPLD